MGEIAARLLHLGGYLIETDNVTDTGADTVSYSMDTWSGEHFASEVGVVLGIVHQIFVFHSEWPEHLHARELTTELLLHLPNEPRISTYMVIRLLTDLLHVLSRHLNGECPHAATMSLLPAVIKLLEFSGETLQLAAYAQTTDATDPLQAAFSKLNTELRTAFEKSEFVMQRILANVNSLMQENSKALISSWMCCNLIPLLALMFSEQHSIRSLQVYGSGLNASSVASSVFPSVFYQMFKYGTGKQLNKRKQRADLDKSSQQLQVVPKGNPSASSTLLVAAYILKIQACLPPKDDFNKKLHELFTKMSNCIHETVCSHAN